MQLSVLIDTYNHERYIDSALRSVLAQEGIDFTEIEIIVIDDGSTDGTGTIVQRYGDVVRYERKPNGGQASAFNFGIPLCQGEVICFLDGDDWWHPEKLKRVREAFRENPTVCGVGHSFVEVDELSGTAAMVGPPNVVEFDFEHEEAVSLFHQFACCLGTSRLAMRRSAAIALLDVPEPLVFEADEYMFTLLPTLGKVLILPNALTYYRIHGGNLYHHSRALQLRYRGQQVHRRAAIYECLSRELPSKMRDRGCEWSLINAALAPVHVQAARLKLASAGGTRLENFRSEYRAGRLEGRSGVRKLILYVSLALTILLPPGWYFIVRQIYANALRRAPSAQRCSVNSQQVDDPCNEEESRG